MARTFDFTANYSNFGNDPQRAEQLRIGSTIDLDSIRILNGPPGGHGFRSGMWKFEHEGEQYEVFSSAPHASELDKQNDIVRLDAALLIAGLRAARR